MSAVADIAATRITSRAADVRDGSPNIVHIHRKPFSGQISIESLFANIREHMRHGGCEVRPVVVPYHSKGFWRRVFNCWNTRQARADVYHITGDIHYVALFLPGNKTILTIHDCWALERLKGFKRCLLKLFWYDLPARRAKYMTVISEEAKRQLLRHVSIADSKVRVIPDAISPLFRPDPRQFNNECPRILHIGTTENKNLARLIRALRSIPCHLHIVGRLENKQVQEVRAARIEFSMEYDLTEEQIVESYCKADIVAFVSTYEGFGLPILEANAVGRPVVTSNVSSMPEVAGDAACFVDPFDVVSIQQGIRRVIVESGYREQLVQNGFENIKRFALETVASKYLGLYQEVYRAQSRV